MTGPTSKYSMPKLLYTWLWFRNLFDRVGNIYQLVVKPQVRKMCTILNMYLHLCLSTQESTEV